MNYAFCDARGLVCATARHV